MTKYIIMILSLFFFGCKQKVDITEFLRSDDFNNKVIRYKVDIAGHEDEYSHIDKNCYYVITDTPDFNITYQDGKKNVIQYMPPKIKFSKFCAVNNVLYGQNCGEIEKVENINYYINSPTRPICSDKNIILSNLPWEFKLNGGMTEKCKISNVSKENILGAEHTVAVVSCDIGGAKIKYFYANGVGFIRAVMNENDIGKNIESIRKLSKK